MFRAIQKVSYKNKPNPRCAKRLWVGADDIKEEGVWIVKSTNKPLENYAKYFQPAQPNGARKQNVAGFHFGTSGTDALGLAQFDDGGEKEKHCFMCKFQSPPRFKIRGLCDGSSMDTFYTLVYDTEHNIPYFKGYDKTMIRLNESVDTKGAQKYWDIMQKTSDKETILIGRTEMSPSDLSLGGGLKSWSFTQPVCSEEERMYLEFSTCSDDEFVCKNDGKCISMETRCDKFPNCEDYSDEENCNTVILGDSYVKDFAPLEKLDEGAYKRTEVFVSVNIIGILFISETEEIFEIKFDLTLNWRDFRVKFHNLKQKTSMNRLTNYEKSLIWVPEVIFVNTKNSEISKSDNTVMTEIIKNETATISSFEINENIHIFEGEKNSFVMKKTYSVQWICHFQMMWYPFDSQTCTMQFRPESNSDGNIELIVDKLIYSGPVELTQYFIKSTKMSSAKEDEEIIVHITLGRRLMGTILTVYLPTHVMVILSQATNYFQPFFFEAVITVNLTIILVICTMFLAIAQSLPTTAYIKMIDLWFILVLLVPFIFTLLHTYLDTVRNYEKNTKGKENSKVFRKMAKNNITVTPKNSPIPAGLVSINEEAQNHALKRHYEDLESVHTEHQITRIMSMLIVWIPLVVYGCMGLYWVVGMSQYYS